MDEDGDNYMDDKLYKAVWLKDIVAIRATDLSNGGESFLRCSPGDKSNVLHVAARYGNKEVISAILGKVPLLDHYELLCGSNSKGQTPLHIAAQFGDLQRVTTLLEAHEFKVDELTSVNQRRSYWSVKDSQGDTPLHCALRSGHEDIAMLLLDKDPALVSFPNKVCESPAYLAADNDCLRFLHKILNGDGSSEYPLCFSGPFGQTAFHPARKLKLTSTLTGDIMTKLIEKGKHALKVQDIKGKTVLHYAVEERRALVIKTLLKADSSLAYLHDEDGLTPLHKAASMGSIGMIQSIMELSPQSIIVRDKCHGRTVLHLAKMDARSMEECLKNTRMKELINEVDNDGNTPLHLALINSDILIADKLLDVDDINWRLANKEGNCLMNLCSSSDHITRKLKHLATSWKVNMEIFFKENVVNIDDMLDNYNWEQCLTYIGPRGDSILHLAARNSCMKIINKVNDSNDALRTLLSKQNSDGETPLHLAAQYGRLEVVNFILSLCSTSADNPSTVVAIIGNEGGNQVVNDENPPSTIVAIGNEGGSQVVNDENPPTIVTLENEGGNQVVNDENPPSTSNPSTVNGGGNQLPDVLPWRIRSANGDTPAHKAVRNHHSNIALLLLKRDTELISLTNNANESLLYLAMDNECISFLRHIQSEDSTEFNDSTTRGRDGQNVLHVPRRGPGARFYKKLAEMKPELLKKVDANGKTPLHYAVERRQASTIRRLLKQEKSAAFVYDNEGYTPLMRAASFGHCACVKSILDLCPQSAELRDLHNGRTVIHLVQMSSLRLGWCMRHPAVRNLVNEIDKDGNTALHLAILDGNMDKAIVLLDTKGLNWRIKNKMHQSPMDLCRELWRSGRTEQRPVHIGLFSLKAVEQSMPNAPLWVSGVARKLVMAYANTIMTEDNAKKLVDNIAVAAGLLLTITSAATFTIPGGYDQNTGYALRMNQHAIKVFMVLDVLSMLMCVSILVKYTLAGGRRDKLRKLAVDSVIMLQISLLAAVVAFVSAAYAIGSPFKSVVTVPIIIAVLLNLVIFLWRDFFEFLF